jgi:sugar phosphate isomerase/epimerase
MNLKNISLNFYSFGFYGGLMRGHDRKIPTIGIDGLVELVEKYGLGGIEIPIDRFYSVDKIDYAIDKIKQIQSKKCSVFIDLESTNVEYISSLVPRLPDLSIFTLRIKMDQIGKTIYGGNRYISSSFKQSVIEFKSQLKSLLPILRKYGVSLAIENHQDFHSSELLDLSRSISRELIGITWDIGNSVSVLQSPESFYIDTKDIIRNVHLKDYKVHKEESGISLRRCPLGEGYVDYVNIFKKLKANTKIINMSIELGAQSPRYCDINNNKYWEEFSSLSIDKKPFLKYVNGIIDSGTEDFSESVMSEEKMIESELYDVEKSVENLKRIFAEI